MKREDFQARVTAGGYTIFYKGKSIGGVGILGQYKGRGRAREAQIKDYTNQARSTIDSILSGNGSAYMKSCIAEIDKGA